MIIQIINEEKVQALNVKYEMLEDQNSAFWQDINDVTNTRLNVNNQNQFTEQLYKSGPFQKIHI